MRCESQHSLEGLDIMVHLFSMQRSGQSLSVLARKNAQGVYTIESINGHDASKFPAFYTKRALDRVTPKDVPVMLDKCNSDFDFDGYAMPSDFEMQFT